MKKIILLLAAAAFAFAACTDEEALVIQKVPQPGDELYDSQYYENLRAWREKDHVLTYVYYAAWAPLEGYTTLAKEYTSMSDRLIGLPDSLDIVNLWMGVPSNDPKDTVDYAPAAYSDLQYCRKTKGMKFVAHADASNYNHQFTVDGKDWDLSSDRSDEAFAAYAQWWCERVIERELDGVDFDFEGWSSADMTKVITKCGEYFGPQGADKTKLLIIDYFGSSPSSDVEPYIDLLVRQAYSQQIGNRYSGLGRPSWLPAEKYVICEQWNQGSNRTNGGYVPYYGYDGEKLMTYNSAGDEVEMASLEAYARYCTDGNGKGFGAYYIDTDYFFASGPYYNLRRCIQIANPAIY